MSRRPFAIQPELELVSATMIPRQGVIAPQRRAPGWVSLSRSPGWLRARSAMSVR